MGLFNKIIDGIFDFVIGAIDKVEKAMIESKISQIPKEERDKLEGLGQQIEDTLKEHSHALDLMLLLTRTDFKILTDEERNEFHDAAFSKDCGGIEWLKERQEILFERYKKYLQNPEKYKDGWVEE